MDPSQIDSYYYAVFEVLTTIVVTSFLIERALSVIFETKWFIDMYESKSEKDGKKKRKGIKEIIAIVVSVAVCIKWEFDAMSIILPMKETITAMPGYIITGLIVAGGSKASIKLFKETLGFMSKAESDRKGITNIP